MATDPVRGIRRYDADHPLLIDVESKLSRLAALPPSFEVPYLTLGLDWQPEGSDPQLRPAQPFVESERNRLLGEYPLRSAAHESLSADFEKILAYLDEDVDPSAQGVIIFTCSAQDVFVPVPLPVPVPNFATVSVTPALSTLTKIVEDAPPYAVLVLDQVNANLMIVDQGTRRQSVRVLGNDYPRRQHTGWWSQRRLQARAEERINAFVRSVAEETRRELEATGVKHLILAGDQQITSLFVDMAAKAVQDAIDATIPMESNATEPEVIAATLRVAEEAEREREAETVRRIENGAGPGGGAVTGPVDTLTALQTGQVMTLAMNDDFSAPGWADYTLPMYGAGAPPSTHPAGGDVKNLVGVPLEEEIVRLAIQTGAEVEIIHTTVSATDLNNNQSAANGNADVPRLEAAQALDRLGGVGAILRYTLSEDQSTAEL